MKIYRSLLIIFVMLVIIAGATYAAWTDQAILGSNTFNTGALSITTTPTSALFNADNIYPGWSQTQSMTVNNEGTVALNYTFLTTKSGTSKTLYESNYFTLKVGTTSGGNDLYDGPVNGATITTPRNINAGSSEILYVTFSLSSDAGADHVDLSNKNATVNLVFNATS